MNATRYRLELCVAALAMLAGGCAVDDPEPYAQARPGPPMRFAGVGVVEDATPTDYDVGDAVYDIEVRPDGSTNALLELKVDGRGGAWVGSAYQAITAPVGARYLDADGLGAWAIEGRFTLEDDGPAVDYAGRAATRWMHLDLANGQLYLTLDVQLAPVDDGAGPTVEGRVDGWGFTRLSCHAPYDPDAPPASDRWVPACTQLVARIDATPDDPSAPPPPFDNRDLISCTVGQPCEGLQPPAPWPGPPREGG